VDGSSGDLPAALVNLGDRESNPKDRENEYYGNYFYGDELTIYKESSG
jgi:hypothetical protein